MLAMDSEALWKSQGADPYLGLVLTSAMLGPMLGDCVTYIGWPSAIATQKPFKFELHT